MLHVTSDVCIVTSLLLYVGNHPEPHECLSNQFTQAIEYPCKKNSTIFSTTNHLKQWFLLGFDLASGVL